MLLLVLFIVFMVLWFVSLFPNSAPTNAYSGIWAFLSVLILFFMIHGVRL